MVATLALIIPIGITILNIIASYSGAAAKKIFFFFNLFMCDKRKNPEKSYIIASCLTSAPSCGTLEAVPNPQNLFLAKLRKIQVII